LRTHYIFGNILFWTFGQILRAPPSGTGQILCAPPSGTGQILRAPPGGTGTFFEQGWQKI